MRLLCGTPIRSTTTSIGTLGFFIKGSFFGKDGRVALVTNHHVLDTSKVAQNCEKLRQQTTGASPNAKKSAYARALGEKFRDAGYFQQHIPIQK